MRRFLRGLVGDEALVDDVLQQALLDAYRGAGTFSGAARVRTWLFTIARNAAFRTIRKTRPADDETLFELGLRAGWGEDPETLALRAEEVRTLGRALASLTTEDREILLLRDVEQLSGPETAEVLGTSLAAMKSRLHRARLRLAAALRGRDED